MLILKFGPRAIIVGKNTKGNYDEHAFLNDKQAYLIFTEVLKDELPAVWRFAV